MKKLDRLDKILSNAGIGSRADVKKIIKSGVVWIDEVAATDPGMKVCAEIQEIKVNGELLNYQKFLYLMMHKPQGVISATEDPDQPTCIDLLPALLKRRNLFPVGRLDRDTEGLLLLTNDGILAHQLLAPKKHVWKKYIAWVTGRLTSAQIEAFENGLLLEDGSKTLPAKLHMLVHASEENDINSLTQVEVVIREGKYHQIKRMFGALGKKVIYLKRVTLGPLQLDESLAPGEYRELTQAEKETLLSLKGNND